MTDYSKDVKRYLNGEMTPAERHALEKKSLSDPFLAEALDGAAQVSADEFNEDIRALNKAIDLKTIKDSENNKFLFWSLRIAAGLLIIFIITYLVINLGDEVKLTPTISQKEQRPSISPEYDKPDSIKDSIQDRLFDKQIALAEEKNNQKEKAKAVERKDITTATIDNEAIKGDEALADVALAKPITEEIKTESIPPVVNSNSENAEKKISPIPSNDASKEAESTIPNRARSATNRNAKKSSVDQNRNASLPSSSVSGIVTSAEDGSPLPGVNVVLKGTTIGTITDAEGKFKLDSASLASTLVYSFIGLQTKEVNVANFNPLSVELNLDVTQLSEMVVIGYGYSNKSEDTPTVDLAHPTIGNRPYKKYLEENLIYPKSAIDNKIEGRVTVEFFVEPNGSLSNFTVIKGISTDCDEELIRLIKQGPIWVPTKRNDQPIRDKARVRLNFQLPKK